MSSGRCVLRWCLAVVVLLTLAQAGGGVAAGAGASLAQGAPTEQGAPGSFSVDWALSGSMGAARVWHSATLLPDGRVLAAGGLGESGPLASAKVTRNPLAHRWHLPMATR